MSIKDMLHQAAEAIGLKRVLILVPLLTPRLSSYWLKLISPDITPLPYREALQRAISGSDLH